MAQMPPVRDMGIEVVLTENSMMRLYQPTNRPTYYTFVALTQLYGITLLTLVVFPKRGMMTT